MTVTTRGRLVQSHPSIPSPCPGSFSCPVPSSSKALQVLVLHCTVPLQHFILRRCKVRTCPPPSQTPAPGQGSGSRLHHWTPPAGDACIVSTRPSIVDATNTLTHTPGRKASHTIRQTDTHLDTNGHCCALPMLAMPHTSTFLLHARARSSSLQLQRLFAPPVSRGSHRSLIPSAPCFDCSR